jgi:hypothetical protein
MQEPSVLDYVKAKLQFWKKEQIIIPSADTTPSADALPEPQPAAEQAAPEPFFVKLPWRSLGALILALAAQRTWEPPRETNDALAGLLIYLPALALLLWANLRGEWKLPALQPEAEPNEYPTVRVVPLAVAGVASVLAFWTFGDNHFTETNLFFWVVALIAFFYAFWAGEVKPLDWLKQAREFVSRQNWQINISRQTLLVLALVGLALFFRLYDLQNVPSEPFSDHAEKILDVYEAANGEPRVFFPRNTGREPLQMYWTMFVGWLFGSGFSYFSLKLGTALLGLLTLPYIYMLGKELGNPRVAALATAFVAVSYWANVISRVGLRFPLYPLFAAPVLFYLIRGIRTSNRNDFLWAGLFLGIGLHGYSPFRIMPILVGALFVLYLLHRHKDFTLAAWRFVLVALTSLVVFIPLLRYWLENPASFGYRAFSRLTPLEAGATLGDPLWQVFFSNLWNALRMLNWSNGEIWVHSIPYRPALDVVAGALFLLGALLVLVRYLRERDWRDIFLLLSIPFLMLPSILALLYPNENPALNRAGAAYIPVFLIVALALDGLLSGIRTVMDNARGKWLAGVVLTVLLGVSFLQNYDLTFNQYADRYNSAAWNTSEMGAVIQQFEQTYGTSDSVFIVPYPHWVDTRLPGVWAGIPNRDFAVFRERLPETAVVPGMKLFMVNWDDRETIATLNQLYPGGVWSTYNSKYPGKSFAIFLVP